jgi:hypothetical protein
MMITHSSFILHPSVAHFVARARFGVRYLAPGLRHRQGISYSGSVNLSSSCSLACGLPRYHIPGDLAVARLTLLGGRALSARAAWSNTGFHRRNRMFEQYSPAERSTSRKVVVAPREDGHNRL